MSSKRTPDIENLTEEDIAVWLKEKQKECKIEFGRVRNYVYLSKVFEYRLNFRIDKDIFDTCHQIRDFLQSQNIYCVRDGKFYICNS